MHHRLLLPLILSFLALAFTAPAQIVINEGSNRNYLLLPDEDGEYPDWVELYNAGNEPVNLFNHSITDKLNKPDKWIFPEGIAVNDGPPKHAPMTAATCGTLPDRRK